MKRTLEGEVNLSLKRLFFLFSTVSTLFIKQARANNLTETDKKLFVGSFPSELESENSSDRVKTVIISKEAEAYLTSPWLTLFVPLIHILVVALGLPLNLMAIILFVFKLKIKKPATVYMLNLASADVLLVILLPFKIAYHFLGNHWLLGSEMCRFAAATFYSNMHCSVLLMMAISIDRFLAVVYPMRALAWRTLTRASVICGAIWLVALAGVIPLFTTELSQRVVRINITTCHDTLDVSVIMKIFRYYFSALSICFFFLPLIITATCYVCIIRKLSSSDMVAKPGKRKRAILLSATVLCSFIVCFAPANILLLAQHISFSPYKPFENLYFAYKLAISASTINCCIDPLIYYYASSVYRRHMWNLLFKKIHLGLNKSSQTTESSAGTFSNDVNNSAQA